MEIWYLLSLNVDDRKNYIVGSKGKPIVRNQKRHKRE